MKVKRKRGGEVSVSAGRYPLEQDRNGEGGDVAVRLERDRATGDYIVAVEHEPRC